MTTWIGIIITAAFLGFLAMNAARSSSISAATAHAQKTGELTPLVAAIEATPEADQPTQWDHAIETLWGQYAREEAAELIIEAAHRSDADIVQYWIRHVHEVEPAIAEQYFTDEFMREHFDPETAARCVKGGCCG
jgi:hypothetical protein